MSRSSDIVQQMQQRRVERKKPKINAKLKKVSIDESQKGGIVAAQENKPPPITMQKTGGRNSVALTFSVGLHVTLALLLGFFYIKQQITAADEDFAVALIPEEPPQTKRAPIKPRPPTKFDAEIEEIDVPVQRTPIKNPDIRKTPSDDFELPSPSDPNLAPAGPGLNEGLRFKPIPGGVRGPVQPEQPVVEPTFDRPSQDPKPIVDIDTVTPSDGPTIIPDIDTTQAGVTPPKTKISRKPEYPKNAKRAEKEGTVILLATITTDGVAKDIKALTDLGFGFEEAAIAALKRFKFIPAKKGDKEIEFDVKIPFEFKLEDK